MPIPTQRRSTENLPHCDHVVCNQKGGTLSKEDVNNIIECLKEQKVIIEKPNGKYELGDK